MGREVVGLVGVTGHLIGGGVGLLCCVLVSLLWLLL